MDASSRKTLLSSASDEWATPRWLFDRLDSEFAFGLDVAASDANALCKSYFTKDRTAFRHPWEGVCWMNPPYSQTGKWVQRALYEVQDHGAIVVALLACRTDTAYWHRFVMQADEIRLIKGRLRFNGVANSAPFPSAVVIWRCWNGKPVTPLLGTIRK